MTRRPVELHPEAIAEARAARQWYEADSPPSAEAFMSEMDRGIELIAESPERWPAYHLGTRRWLFRRFPFSLVYRVKEEVVIVVAVAHAKRQPAYWRKRR
ncbi:MAG TPA: type II toxin-antitoxin system RelE/ParE family toxin [Myxococcales bacterium]|nr:type II toxin-antitoxin system RelE/ParE family toxin [Myxococcales bacterium]